MYRYRVPLSLLYFNLNYSSLINGAAPKSYKICGINPYHQQRFFCRSPATLQATSLSTRVDRCVGVEHEEYLEAVNLTSYVGTIPTWLASYFLV